MQIRESFVAPAPVKTIWTFFEDVESVSKCVPGLQSLTILAPDQYQVVVKQKVGFFSATFQITTKREDFELHRFMQFSSVGRTIKGAMGNLRSVDRVEFEAIDDNTTQVNLTAHPALGGMLGTVGHRVIVSRSRELTEQFAQALCAALNGVVVMEPS